MKAALRTGSSALGTIGGLVGLALSLYAILSYHLLVGKLGATWALIPASLSVVGLAGAGAVRRKPVAGGVTMLLAAAGLLLEGQWLATALLALAGLAGVAASPARETTWNAAGPQDTAGTSSKDTRSERG